MFFTLRANKELKKDGHKASAIFLRSNLRSLHTDWAPSKPYVKQLYTHAVATLRLPEASWQGEVRERGAILFSVKRQKGLGLAASFEVPHTAQATFHDNLSKLPVSIG